MNENLLELTAHIVSAYVEKNPVPQAGLSELIANVSSSLSTLGLAAAEPLAPPIPAVNPKKSIHRDYLISLEDGRRYKTLRRHLSGRGLTPDEYRTKWNLPTDYPMVAAAYSERRSQLAKSLRLGRKAGPVAPNKRVAKQR